MGDLWCHHEDLQHAIERSCYRSMPPLPHSPPSGHRRHLVNLFIAVTVLASITVPTSYYVSADTYDERFAWRMFSGKRAERCSVQVIETRKVDEGKQRTALSLTRIIHKAWESGLKRLRPDVMTRLFELRCEDPAVESLTLVRRCRRADGGKKPDDEVTHACPLRVVVP